MTNKQNKRHTIFRQLILNLLLPVLLPFIIISIVYTYHNQAILESNNEEKKYILVEQLKMLIDFEDIALDFLEEAHTKRMKVFSEHLVNNRFKNTNDIESANLLKIANKNDVNFDIYIIDRTGEVINTTFNKDLGFNLFDISISHKQFLLNVFNGGKFVNEKLSLEVSTGKQKKYTYHPTLDQKYIIELGSYSPRATQLINAMNTGVHKLVQNDKLNLQSIDLFIGKENKKSFLSEATIGPDHEKIFEQSFQQKKNFDTIIQTNGQLLQYEYIYFSRKKTDLYNEAVIRIVSDITNERRLLYLEMTIFISILISTILILIALFYFRAKIITRPIVNLVEQIKRIEQGDFQGQVTIKGSNEITDLSVKFNIMITKLHLLYSNLENKVKERTSQLEKQKKELQIQAAELDKLSIVASETNSIVIIMDAKGKMEWANKAYEKMYGYDYRIVLEKYGSSIFELSETPNIEEVFEKCIKTKQPVSYKSYIHHKPTNEKFWMQTNLTPIMNKHGEVYKVISIETDITHLIEIEDQLKQAKQKAENANHAKSEFLANMSHEIRTPMNSIIGFGELLQTIVADQRQKNYVGYILSSASNLLNLINDILDLSKIEAGKIEIKYSSVNIRQLLDEINNIFMVRVNEKSLEFKVEVDDQMPHHILFDEVRLRQIFLNLVGNAVKFTHKGHVKILASISPNAKGDDYCDLKFIVEDTGIGISPSAIDLIFDPFVQQDTKHSRKYEGTGLGLAITKRFIEMLNGTIQVTSSENQGSSFEVLFKDVQITSAPVEAIKKTSLKNVEIDIEFEDAHILVVDDIEKNRDVVIEALKNKTVKVDGAQNGKEAIEKMQKTHYNLILMDIRMPVMNGFEAITYIKNNEELKHIPIIALTASGMLHDREKISKHKFDGLLIKPVHLNDLYEKMSHFLKYKKIKNTEKNKKTNQSNNLFQGSHQQLTQFIETLENEFIPIYKKNNQAFVIKRVNNFAIKLKKLSEQYQYQPLITFSNNLKERIDEFDIHKTKNLLTQFIVLFENLKKQIDNQN